MTPTGIYAYDGTLQELAIQVGRLPHKDISKLLELISDEVYKKAVKHNSGQFYTVVDQLDAASRKLKE